MSIITWIVGGISLVGTIANMKQKKWCFVMWMVGNSYWMYYSISRGLYPRAVLDAIYLGLAVYGFFEWRKMERKRENEV